MKKEPLLGQGLKILDKHAYCRRLILGIMSGETEFMERRFYELCFTLYARFCAEKLSPQLIYPYFVLAEEAFNNYPDVSSKNIKLVISLGLQLNDFAQYSENALQLSNIMLQINGLIAQWHQQHHICRYCGHALDLLTQKINEKDCVLS
jgi:hypothetical protein